ncbi:NAD-dependent epimerase/dehydratase family protein [Ruegeria sp. PrR005]|uniref:NAD-dependent epimerase/dehydratase family protein n=1 Tax=Ruegeria sp. PrR005 TaxID=2706882 RepID=A0A6B2NP16_9RHOB|nr:NAD-dependent epimerase/dehydratase family protein [Ruegeria sp. PrR005]NDW44249.1 NAD-dependent epimerase/dehydratase family protein [Ruegeria sp. PrR005]
MQTALVTGAAGFIGYHLSLHLLQAGWRVIGLDSLNAYYDPELKRRRLAMLERQEGFLPVTGKLETPGLLTDLFAAHRPTRVFHLAAQAGVRHSIEAPRDYVEANLMGTYELLEAARAHPPEHMLLASTSSVYGANTAMPYAETDKADSQMSFYAATKKANEAMAHSYAHLFGMPVTMFRFFTVYGPWGRPDMAYFKFTRAILSGETIDVYNNGRMRRDFTYIDDLVSAILGLAEAVPGTAPVGDHDSLSPVAPFRVVNIGASQPVELMAFIRAIETACDRPARMRMLPMQPGDVPATWAETRLLRDLTGAGMDTPLATGMQHFVDWYRTYYRI